MPGVLFSASIAVLAWALQQAEQRLFGIILLEGVVIAILAGIAWRTLLVVPLSWNTGISFAGRDILAVAIVLLGASVDFPALFRAGPPLILLVIVTVWGSLALSTAIARRFGLNPKLAILIACGNAICGNSAIAAIAPVIHAEPEDVTSAIALTAILGIAVVLLLPLLIPLLGFNFYQYGILAGMSVYAVPQVLAATLPVSAVSVEIGTLVKLARVLMLGPVALFFSVQQRANSGGGLRLSLFQYVPWFVVGFMVMGALRSVGTLPAALGDTLREVSRWMTLIAMAALGLSVNVRSVRTVGPPVAMSVSVSLVALIGMVVVFIRVLQL
jgi:uncharacterized integral membrane protein (TIGR00698 family)